MEGKFVEPDRRFRQYSINRIIRIIRITPANTPNTIASVRETSGRNTTACHVHTALTRSVECFVRVPREPTLRAR